MTDNEAQNKPILDDYQDHKLGPFLPLEPCILPIVPSRDWHFFTAGPDVWFDLEN